MPFLSVENADDRGGCAYLLRLLPLLYQGFTATAALLAVADVCIDDHSTTGISSLPLLHALPFLPSTAFLLLFRMPCFYPLMLLDLQILRLSSLLAREAQSTSLIH
jgi:hypothetical protein